MSASKQRRGEFDQSKFHRDVVEFYSAARNVQDELSKIWCHVSGEHHLKKDVKATYIVPKSLESNELAYVFGMGESLLSPRNS